MKLKLVKWHVFLLHLYAFLLKKVAIIKTYIEKSQNKCVSNSDKVMGDKHEENKNTKCKYE